MHNADFAITINQPGRTARDRREFLHSSFFNHDWSYAVANFRLCLNRDQRNSANDTVANTTCRKLCGENSPALRASVKRDAWQHTGRRFFLAGCVNGHSGTGRQRVVRTVPDRNPQAAVCRSFGAPASNPAGCVDQISEIIFQNRVRLEWIAPVNVREKCHISPQIPRLPNPSV